MNKEKKVFSYQTGVEFPTAISLKPNPRIPSNLASKNVIPGSLVASMNSCGNIEIAIRYVNKNKTRLF